MRRRHFLAKKCQKLSWWTDKRDCLDRFRFLLYWTKEIGFLRYANEESIRQFYVACWWDGYVSNPSSERISKDWVRFEFEANQ